jgi:hypothetical protein
MNSSLGRLVQTMCAVFGIVGTLKFIDIAVAGFFILVKWNHKLFAVAGIVVSF